MQPDLPLHNATATSRAAAEHVKPKVESCGRKILAEIAGRGIVGLTSFELVERLCMNKQTVTARLNDLDRAGCIRASENTRPCPKTKCKHAVYQATGIPYNLPPKRLSKYDLGKVAIIKDIATSINLGASASDILTELELKLSAISAKLGK